MIIVILSSSFEVPSLWEYVLYHPWIWYVWRLSYTINHLYPCISIYHDLHITTSIDTYLYHYIFILLIMIFILRSSFIIIYIYLYHTKYHTNIILYIYYTWFIYIISYIWWFNHQFFHQKKYLRPSATSSAPCRCCLGRCGTGLGGAAVSRQREERNWEDAARQGWNFSMIFTWI